MIDNDQHSRLQRMLHQLPETPRLILVALFGGLIGLVVYEIVYYFNPLTPRATSSWLVSIMIAVPRQHALHRWLTYIDRTPYWASLGRAYLLYSSVAALTTLLNYVLVEYMQLHHRVAWAICIATAATINLFLLKRVVYYDSHRRSRE